MKPKVTYCHLQDSFQKDGNQITDSRAFEIWRAGIGDWSQDAHQRMLEQLQAPWFEWVPWMGGDCPFLKSDDVSVEILVRNGRTLISDQPANLRWHHCEHAADIVAYRTVRRVVRQNMFHPFKSHAAKYVLHVRGGKIVDGGEDCVKYCIVPVGDMWRIDCTDIDGACKPVYCGRIPDREFFIALMNNQKIRLPKFWEWTVWEGGTFPNPGAIVDVVLRNGNHSHGQRAEDLDWSHTGDCRGWEITLYKIRDDDNKV